MYRKNKKIKNKITQQESYILIKHQQELMLLKKIDNNITEDIMIDITELIGNTRKRLIKNFTSGIFKGVGAGIGFSIVTALIIYFVQKIIRLNIPIISQYIADIVEIVKNAR